MCIAAVSSVLWGCGRTTVEETVEDVAVVEAANPVIGNLSLSNNFIAVVNPDESVYVIPKTTGEVLKVLVGAGDTVEEGDVLAVLDDTMAQITMDNARLGLNNAQLSLDNAQHSYNLQYGEGASVLNEMQSDNTLSQAGDGVESLQEGLVDAMDSLEQLKAKLRDAENELADLKREYDFNEDVEEIREYAETLQKEPLDAVGSLGSAMGGMGGITVPAEILGGLSQSSEYSRAMTRYQEAAQKVARVEAEISQYKAAIDQCEESIETLQDNIDSTYRSYSQAVVSDHISNGEIREEQKQVSQNSIAAAELGIQQAQGNIQQARENLDAYTITATISGVVESVNIKEHDFASSGNPAFVISNKDAMVATYYVSEDVRNTFSAGQKITLEKDDVIYDGEVIEIGSAVDMNTGLFRIKAAVRGDTSGLLSGTKATVITDTYHENNAVIIPYDAVYYDGTQAYVYTVAEGKARKTNITTGLYDTDNIVVTDGLAVSDTVITTWSAQLREGVEVSIRGTGQNAEDNTRK